VLGRRRDSGSGGRIDGGGCSMAIGIGADFQARQLPVCAHPNSLPASSSTRRNTSSLRAENVAIVVRG
jgi:hypothetical protein